jgi:hypothetical protein
MRIPTYPRHSATHDRTEPAATATPGPERTDTGTARRTDTGTARGADAVDRDVQGRPADLAAADRDRMAATRADAAADRPDTDRTDTDRTGTDRTGTDRTDDYRAGAGRAGAGEPVVAGPKPRASLLATLALIAGVAAALLVLSGPLIPYGIGVAGLALVLSLGGIHATGRRHVAGKTDALIGMVLALAAIVVGVLALTGSLSWLGTGTHSVDSVRHWLDAQFVNRF